MMAIFSGFCTLPLGKEDKIVQSDPNKLFVQLLRISERMSEAAGENKKLLESFQAFINAIAR